MMISSAVADLAVKGLRLLEPETAHRATIALLRMQPARAGGAIDLRLQVRAAGLDWANPIGLAAGFDKNAEVPNQMLGLGFGHVEIGAATPLAQPGNPSPRVFRLTKNEAVINRLGFNNEGVEAIAHRLRARARRGLVGANLGANKDSADRIGDYVIGIEGLAGLVDYYSINISSPNTPGLRALHDAGALNELITRALEARARFAAKTPVFLKISPDLTDADLADIVAIAPASGLDGLIISNTTITRPDQLDSPHKGETGGLSGRPLFAPSTRLLGDIHRQIGDQMTLIGVGGVSNAREAYQKILAGASLVQIYTALIYQGPNLPRRILAELPKLMEADGFGSIEAAIGQGAG